MMMPNLYNQTRREFNRQACEKTKKGKTEVLIVVISGNWQNLKRKTLRRSLEHRVGRARTSDLLENTFIMVVYENFFYLKILTEL